jgi:hypothetical protein
MEITYRNISLNSATACTTMKQFSAVLGHGSAVTRLRAVKTESRDKNLGGAKDVFLHLRVYGTHPEIPRMVLGKIPPGDKAVAAWG